MSVKRYDFSCYAFYDSARLDVQECEDGDYVLHTDYVELEARHNALREAVAWERECGEMRFTDIWFDEWSRTESQAKNAMIELRATVDAARAEVDCILQEKL